MEPWGGATSPHKLKRYFASAFFASTSRISRRRSYRTSDDSLVGNPDDPMVIRIFPRKTMLANLVWVIFNILPITSFLLTIIHQPQKKSTAAGRAAVLNSFGVGLAREHPPHSPKYQKNEICGRVRPRTKRQNNKCGAQYTDAPTDGYRNPLSMSKKVDR